MGKKRSRLQIIRDILTVIREKNGRIKPTHILYKSNLSHAMMDEYLKDLQSKGFIIEQQHDKSRTYSVTKKGEQYLEQYSMISEFTSAFGLDEE